MDYFRDLKHTKIVDKKEFNDFIEKKKLLIPKINSGYKNIDNALNGGFYPQTCYLIFGPNTSGKTQFCHQLCIQAFKNSIKTIFLDSENTFRPERINELSKESNIDGEKVLKNILVSKIMSNTALNLKLGEVEQKIQENALNLLIIDSINNYYRVEHGERHISSHSSKINFQTILEKINLLTTSFNLITILTAQVAPNFILDEPIRELPVGLSYLNHYFSEFIYLSTKEQAIGSMHYVNSIFSPEKKIQYRITKSGIVDYKI